MVLVTYEFVVLPIYNITLHPLAKFPGPKTWAATGFVEMYHVLNGDLPFAIQELHKIYGPVVRTGPNEMSYINEEAWEDIHGRYDGRVQLKKAKEFTPTKLPNGAQGLVFVHDDADHARLRWVYSPNLPAVPQRHSRRQAAVINGAGHSRQSRPKVADEPGEISLTVSLTRLLSDKRS